MHPGPWIRLSLTVVVAAAALTACGAQATSDSSGSPDALGTAAPAAPAEPVAGGGPESSPGEDATGALLLTAADLPTGWRDSNPPSGGFRMTVCGVDIEPTEPTGTQQVRFAQTAVGPFLYQYVRQYASAGVPGQVTEALAEALPGCTTFTTRGDAPGSPEASFSLAQLAVGNLPAGSVAWRMTPRTENPITQDVVLIPRGETLVAFLSASLGADPDPAVLEAAIDALQARD